MVLVGTQGMSLKQSFTSLKQSSIKPFPNNPDPLLDEEELELLVVIETPGKIKLTFTQCPFGDIEKISLTWSFYGNGSGHASQKQNDQQSHLDCTFDLLFSVSGSAYSDQSIYAKFSRI